MPIEATRGVSQTESSQISSARQEAILRENAAEKAEADAIDRARESSASEQIIDTLA